MRLEYECGEVYTPRSVGGSPFFRGCGGWQTNDVNSLGVINWINFFADMALTSFEWSGLPDGITGRAIETCMLYQGLGGMFSDESGRLRFAPASPIGRLDMYYEPVNVEFIAPNGAGNWSRRCKADYGITAGGMYEFIDADAVCLYDNTARVPLMMYIDMYAQRISKMERLVDVNIGAQATPWIARSTELGRKDIINKIVQVTGNEPVIVENEGMRDDTSLDVMKTDAPFVADKILDVQARVMNQLYTVLGIDNSFNTKKEREINAEVDGNNEQIMIRRKSRLYQREQFCERCNDLFGTDMSVAWAVDHDGNGKVDMASGSELGEMV